MPIDDTGLYYTKIEDFIKWISSNFAGMLSNDTPNVYESTEDAQRELIKEALLHSEGRVDGFLKKRGYKVPIDASYVRSINAIKIYVYNLAVYELYGRRGITKERYYKYTNTITTLKALSTGEEQLPDDPPFSKGRKVSSGNNLPSVFAESDRSHANSI